MKDSRRDFLQTVAGALAGSLVPGELARATEYAAGDVRKYGVVPNKPEAATANTAALKALVAPQATFAGNLYFPNTTGSDLYYFNDVIAFRGGIHLDLMKSTLTFTKTGSKEDAYTGFIHAIRDFSIQNGSIAIDYAHTAGANAGNALAFGARGDSCALFPNVYDALLAAPMGNITVKNIRISSNAGVGARGIFMIGGLNGIDLEDVSIEGRERPLLNGIYYEFGWASNEGRAYKRRTSHAQKVRLKNLSVRNVVREAFAANGAYAIEVDGLKVADANGVCAFGPGESLYYRPWVSGAGSLGTPQIVMRDISGDSIRGTAILVTGASRLAPSYLDNAPAHDNPNGLTIDQQTDLIDFKLDGFKIAGTASNGVSTSARRAVIRNGTLQGFQRGIVTTQECTRFLFDGVKVLDSGGIGIQIGQSVSLHTPPRRAVGVIRNCFVAGSGTVNPSPAITVGTTASCVIETCRFGYEIARDGKAETTQMQAVSVAGDALAVVCRNNHVAGVARGAPAFRLAGASPGSRQCWLDGNDGAVTATGPWMKKRDTGAPQLVSPGSTVRTVGVAVVRVAAGAPVANVTLQPGTESNQAVIVMPDGPATNTIDFDRIAPSNASHAESGAKTGNSSRLFVWDRATGLWSELR